MKRCQDEVACSSLGQLNWSLFRSLISAFVPKYSTTLSAGTIAYKRIFFNFFRKTNMKYCIKIQQFIQNHRRIHENGTINRSIKITPWNRLSETVNFSEENPAEIFEKLYRQYNSIYHSQSNSILQFFCLSDFSIPLSFAFLWLSSKLIAFNYK